MTTYNEEYDYHFCIWGYRFVNYSDELEFVDLDAICCFEEFMKSEEEGNECLDHQIELYTNLINGTFNQSQIWTGPHPECRYIENNNYEFSQYEFLLWLPLVAALLVPSFIMTTKRKHKLAIHMRCGLHCHNK